MPYRASPVILKKLIEDLRSLTAIGFTYDSPTLADLNRLGFDKPKRTLQLTFQKDEPDLILELSYSEDDKENLYARTNRSDYIYRIDRRTSLLAFPLNELHYRSRILETLPEAARIVSLELIEENSGETILKLDTKNDNFLGILLAEEPKGVRDAIQTVLDWVRKVRVESLLSKSLQRGLRRYQHKPKRAGLIG